MLGLPRFGSLSSVVWTETGGPPEGTEIGFAPDSYRPGRVLDVNWNPVKTVVGMKQISHTPKSETFVYALKISTAPPTLLKF